MKILRVVSITDAFIHIRGQLKAFEKKGFSITLASNKEYDSKNLIAEINFPHRNIPFAREISLLKDIKSLFALIKLIKENKPDILHSSTPKAGLVCALAGFLTGVPVRIHTFTGQRWATLKGFKRSLLIFIDKLIANLNTAVYTDSPSQSNFLVESKIVSSEKISCLGEGSLGGIDLDRFNFEKYQSKKNELKNNYNIPVDKTLILYLGRVNTDKGINELVDSFCSEELKKRNALLLLVGPYEKELDPLNESTIKAISDSKNIMQFGKTTVPEEFFALCDIFCIPSYREGFGTVVLEASALGVPSVGTKIPGLVDSIVDGETGLLVEKKNSTELTKALCQIIDDEELRLRLGENARKRAVEKFNFDRMTDLQWEEYKKLLSLKN